MLMRSIWVRGRARHLGEPLEEVYHPIPPEALYTSRGLRRHVIADVYLPFPAEGEQQQLSIRSANLQALPVDEASDRSDERAAE